MFFPSPNPTHKGRGILTAQSRKFRLDKNLFCFVNLKSQKNKLENFGRENYYVL